MSTTHVTVYVGGAPYRAGIDRDGVLRFERNWILDSTGFDLNALAVRFQREHRADPAALRQYAEVMMGLGYSCSGFCDLSAFAELEVRAPTWVRNGARPWERVELEQRNTQRTLARLMKTIWDCALTGAPTPAQLKAYERARRPRPGDLVLELSSLRFENFEGTGRLILARRERVEGGDEDQTELVWYVEQLDGRLARWRNATFIAAPIEPDDDPKAWALEAANRHDLGRGLGFELYRTIYECDPYEGGWG